MISPKNISNFIGNLGRDPEKRYTPSGTAVINASIGVDTGYGDNKRTDWVPLVIWGKAAETFEQLCQKGTMIAVTATYQTSEYEKDGEKRYRHEFRVESWQLLKNGKARSDGETSSGSGSEDDEFPF